MKRLVVFLCVSALVFAVATPLMAGGIENKHNYSAEYIRTLNRNAATDSADAVVYNPAGVVKMEDGFYVNLSGQYAFKDYSNTVGGTEYDSDEPDIVPSLFALYRKDERAVYAAFTIPAGGGSVDYTDGMATTLNLAQQIIAGSNFLSQIGFGADVYDGTIADMDLEGESFHYGITFGGAVDVNDWLSVSAGLRYIDANREFEGSATLNRTAFGTAADVPQTYRVKYEETDDGWGGILGVNISPTEKLNIGIRYETETSLDLKTDEKTDDLNGSPLMPNGVVTDGAKRERDLPALIGLGVSHQCTDRFRSEVNFTYYLNDAANWDDDPVTAGDETDKDNGYDLGIAFEYLLMPDLKVSIGYMYTNTGIDDDDMLMAAPELDAHTIAGGFAYEVMPGLNFNFGILNVFYQDETNSAGVKLEKEVVMIALGVQYKFW
jgi:long-chain fatty acid transport protein